MAEPGACRYTGERDGRHFGALDPLHLAVLAEGAALAWRRGGAGVGVGAGASPTPAPGGGNAQHANCCPFRGATASASCDAAAESLAKHAFGGGFGALRLQVPAPGVCAHAQTHLRSLRFLSYPSVIRERPLSAPPPAPMSFCLAPTQMAGARACTYGCAGGKPNVQAEGAFKT